ncbi:hypothetical protein ALO48_102522 [Pseudomonas syringae pv. rhaphiolepidis]|uniref:Uncharacterized protein n=1 Tax=Pseudomonas amygdali pv. tabaci TaxID=322 RepID=A0A3M6G181_PSEAJ|nr:hypothetical protein ALO48_102522 [Pseudomonas syringae pv. rhaphiolepidis]KPY56838.1 hypothetical protein ALO93_102725 [Pseudomonas amygdali pv. sesami]RMN64300.1 hypothetical protein ALQ56_03332 [Pseudomonas syringae pv. papulans]RMV85946.1 hypothetical protein ALP03_102742 [Pseudomonas amygdali pv. tabaci]RMT91436.1 hypothetical protein ALP38_102375 [Pseudomonas amygdali pv. sesami]
MHHQHFGVGVGLYRERRTQFNDASRNTLFIDKCRAAATVERVMRINGAGGEFGIYRAEVSAGQ